MTYELQKEQQFYIGKGVDIEATKWLEGKGVEVPSREDRRLHLQK